MTPQPADEPPLDVARVVESTWVDWGRSLHEAASTNDAALAAVDSAPAGESGLFVTERQPAGRGRGSNKWWSPRGALAFSVLTRRLDVPTDRLAQASLAVGVAVCEALEPFAPVPVRLKWPNDVFAEGRKLCGVLIEAPARAPGRLVVGVGVNVNNSAAEAPEGLRDKAIGLVDLVSGAPHEPRPQLDRTEVLTTCVAKIGELLLLLEKSDPLLSDRWRDRSLLTGRSVRLDLGTREVTGVVQTIADDGALVLQTDLGEERCYGGTVVDW